MKFIFWLVKHMSKPGEYAIAIADHKEGGYALRLEGAAGVMAVIMAGIARSLMSECNQTLEDIMDIIQGAKQTMDK